MIWCDIWYMIWYDVIWYGMIWYDIYDIFVNCNWVATRWQQYSTHLHTNNTQNNTFHQFGRVLAVPRLCELYPDICLTTEQKARKTLSQGSWRMPVGTMKTEYTEQNIQTIFHRCVINVFNTKGGRSRWPCGLRCRTAAGRLQGPRVRIPLRSWMFVSYVCCSLRR
jgi:hypothetical protein